MGAGAGAPGDPSLLTVRAQTKRGSVVWGRAVGPRLPRKYLFNRCMKEGRGDK